MPGGAELAIIITAKDMAAKTLKNASKELGGLGGAAENAAKGLDTLGSKAQRMGMMLSVATAPLLGIGIAAIKMAMDAVESENLFEVSMGEMAGAARQFSEELRNQFGLNAYEVRKNVGTLNAMVGAMGVGKAASFDMAKGLTQLSYDMASFHNLKSEEAFGKLQAAISGESEPMKRLGYVINDTTIKQWALNQGLIKQGDEMSEAQKVVARYGLIMEQTSKAQGDLGRTMDSPSNQLRVFKARLEETAIEAGQVFLPVLSGALSWLNEKGLPAVRNAVDDLKASWGEMSDDAKKRILITAGLFLASGPLLGAIGIGIKGVALLAKAFQLLPASANIGIAAGVAIFVAFKDQIADIVSSVGMTIRNLGVSLEPLGGSFYDLGLKMRYAGRDVWIVGEKLKNIENVPAAVGNALLDMASTPAFDLLIEQFDKLGLSVSDSAATVGMYEGELATSMKRVAGATNNAIDPLTLWRQAAVNAADGADKLKKEAEKAGISVSDLTAALIAIHPATLAAVSAVAMWDSKIASVNLALSANRDQLKAAQAEYQALSDRLGDLNRQLSDAKSKLTDLSQPKLKGMGEFDTKTAAIETQLKRIKLAETMGIPLDAIIKKYPLLEKVSEKYLKTLPKTEEELRKILDQLNLQKGLTFDEQLKVIKEAAGDAQKELTFEEALQGIKDTKAEIGNLTNAVAAQEAAMRAQQGVIASLNAASEALNATLATLQEELRGAEAKQRLVNDALTIAYDWFLKDREKIVEMGGAASEVAETMDAKTLALLSAVNQAATDTTSISTATLASMVLAYKKDMAIAVSEVAMLKGQLAAIPRDITTIHTTIRKYVDEEGGDTGTTTTTTPLGTYASGTSYVPQTGPYILHQGEAVIPARRSAERSINITVTGNTILSDDRTVARELARILKPHLDGLVELRA